MNPIITNFANNQVLISFKDPKTGALTGLNEFWSYGVKIAETKSNGIFIDSENWDYSKTTIKYLCKYLGYRGKKTIQDALKNGVMKLAKLNSCI